MKRYTVFFIPALLMLSLFIMFSGCIDDEEEEGCVPAPYDCQETPYSSGRLSINVTLNPENPNVNIYIYQGNVEGTPYKVINGWASTSWSSTESMGSYSAKVDYTVGSVTVTAIDGDSIRSTSSNYCGGVTCYGVDDAELDLTFDLDAFREFLDGTDEECFIATAAFGSPLAREVAILRNFRDSVLRPYAPGRLFIALYYRFSPSAAEVIRGNEGFRTIARGVLYPVVWGVAHPIGFFGLIVILGIGGAMIGIKAKRK